jgi:hypothetical protein
MRAAGLSARAMAAELEARKILTPNGARWHAQTVLRAMARIGLDKPGERIPTPLDHAAQSNFKTTK